MALTNIAAPMIAKKPPLYHLRRPSAYTIMVTASAMQTTADTKVILLNVAFVIVSLTFG